MTTLSDFGRAFRDARNSGKKTFTWNGKLYTTKLKGEDSKASSPSYARVPKVGPVPAQRPTNDATTTTTSNAGAVTTADANSSRPTDITMAAAKAAERSLYDTPSAMDLRRSARSGQDVHSQARADTRFSQPKKLTEIDKRRAARTTRYDSLKINPSR